MNHSLRAAFTLVELSIVLVIIGLLTGGILTGRSLIHAAQMRSVISELQHFRTAVANFRDKYEYIPGDLPDATLYWGDNNAVCPDAGITNGTPGTCDGDGDEQIDESVVVGATSESLQFWTQMQLAGVLEGSFPGIVPAGATLVPGTDVPASRLTKGGWSANYISGAGGPANYAVFFGNSLLIGAQTTSYVPWGRLLKPEDAWNIDTKLDDGKPARGGVIARFWDDECASADDGDSDNDDLNASYRVSDPTAQCALYFNELF